MNKKIYFAFIIIALLLIPSVTSENIVNKSDQSKSEFNVYSKNSTFLIGTIYKPIENGSSVNASAISLVYYNKNIFIDNIGLVQGFKKISFVKAPFFLIYKPGPLGLIAYVFGNCEDFTIY